MFCELEIDEEPIYEIEAQLVTEKCIRCQSDFVTTDEGKVTHNICRKCAAGV
jgi:hypothetical protein